MYKLITLIAIMFIAQICYGGDGNVVNQAVNEKSQTETLGCMYQEGDVQIRLNGGENVAYVGDTTTIEVWIKNDEALQALSLPFEFSIGRNYQFISSGAFGYVNPEGDAVGAFDLIHLEYASIDNVSPDSLAINGCAMSPSTKLPKHMTHSLCYTMQVYILPGQNELTDGICIDNIAFYPPPMDWFFDDTYGGYPPDFQGNPNSSYDNPDAPPVCFDILKHSTNDVTVHLNGGDDVAYIGDTNTVELWIKNDFVVRAMSLGFEFSLGRDYQFNPNHKPGGGYAKPEGDMIGAFDDYPEIAYIDNNTKDSLHLGAISFFKPGLSIHNEHTLCYTMKVYIPPGQDELVNGFCIDNIVRPPAGFWEFDGNGGIVIPPDFQGKPNSAIDNPDAPPVCFDIVQPPANWSWKEPFANYAPHTPGGMPDFDQKQDSWQAVYPGPNGQLETLPWNDDIYIAAENIIAPGPNCKLESFPGGDDIKEWIFSGPAAVANCFWWFDSKYADSTGYPGDGQDQFPLVQGYHDDTEKAVDQEQPNWAPYPACVDLSKVKPGHVQSFVPTHPVLDAVQIALSKTLEGLDTIEVCIYDQLPINPQISPLGCSRRLLDVIYSIDTAEWYQFHFNPAIDLIPGETYYLAVQDIQDSSSSYRWAVHWHFWADDNAYPLGTGWEGTMQPYVLNPKYGDWAFKTEYYVSDALDDHAAENVPFLIEDLAGRMQTCIKGETDIYDMQNAIYGWLVEKGLEDMFVENTYLTPTFFSIADEIELCHDVILQLGFFDFETGGKVIDQEQSIWDGDPAARDIPPWFPGNLQSFVPNEPILDAVQLLIWFNEINPTTVEVSIYDTYPDNPDIEPIGFTSMLVNYSQNPEWFQFHFLTTLYLSPGETYYIAARVLDVLNNVHWCYSTVDPYPYGIAYFNYNDGIVEPRPFEDYAFRTEYYGDECVRKGTRYVTCAGVDAGNFMIAISDPYHNIQDPSGNDHNDAQYVSHETYTIAFGSPCPLTYCLWWLPDYPSQYMYTLVENAVVISSTGEPGTCGDANGDGNVNISDAVWIINYIFDGGQPPDPLEAGDANCDATCNIADAVWIINYIFAGGNGPCDTDGDGIADCSPKGGSFKRVASGSAELNLMKTTGDRDVNEVLINLNSEREVQGVQLEFAIKGRVKDIKSSATVAGIQLFDGDFGNLYKVGLLDLKGQVMIPAGTNEILTIEYRGDGELVPVEAILVGTDGGEFEVTIKYQKSEATVPDKFSLSQNIPNPFNPSTKINYSLPKAGNVRLDIYNILGQKVTTLVNDHQEAGIYTVTWDGNDADGRQVSSGIYLYRLMDGDMVQTKKMVLMK